MGVSSPLRILPCRKCPRAILSAQTLPPEETVASAPRAPAAAAAALRHPSSSSSARARSSISRAHEAGAASPVAVSAGCGAANVVVVRVLVPTAAALRHPLSSRTAREHQSSAREVIDLARARGWGCLTGGRVGRMRRRRRRRRPFPCPLGRGVAASIVVPHGAGASV